MGYETVQKFQAKRMAKAAGLKARHIRDIGFREVMAEHAVQLLIAIAAKDKLLRIKRERPTMTPEDRKNLELAQQRRRREATRQANSAARTARIERMMSLACPKRRRYA